MGDLLRDVLAEGPWLTDGAWGTQMHERGLRPGDCAEAWNLTRPERVEEVARAYVQAGSQVIITNTFSANRIALQRHDLADKAARINQAGVEISRRAAASNGKVRVFASIGPTGKLLMMGQATEQELAAAFQEQADALAAAGADAIVVETMSDPQEAAIAVRAAKQTGLPVIGCMVFDSGKDKDRTMMGTTPEEAVEALIAAGADGVGANCGRGVAGFVGICRRMRSATESPVWIKANAGLPEIVDGQTVYRQTPEQFASFTPDLIEAGANFVGGCCGTTPEFIAAVRRRLAG